MSCPLLLLVLEVTSLPGPTFFLRWPASRPSLRHSLHIVTHPAPLLPLSNLLSPSFLELIPHARLHPPRASASVLNTHILPWPTLICGTLTPSGLPILVPRPLEGWLVLCGIRPQWPQAVFPGRLHVMMLSPFLPPRPLAYPVPPFLLTFPSQCSPSTPLHLHDHGLHPPHPPRVLVLFCSPIRTVPAPTVHLPASTIGLAPFRFVIQLTEALSSLLEIRNTA